MRLASPATAVVALLLCATAAGAHELDHPVPAFEVPASPPSSNLVAGGTNATWELVRTIATGNPHSDLDFFQRDGETYLSAGTLGVGPNAGGQTIVQLTSDGEVSPRYVGAHGSAACASATTSATGLQHDVEATPKGGTMLNDRTTRAVGGDAELLIDATDAAGRCHDNGTLGARGAPSGGLEIIDVTDPAKPVELALIRATGNAHTVNVDPKRPHIAFIVTQDGVSVGADGRRGNETSGPGLDGFEIVDLSSCMGFPEGTTVGVKRALCKPEVFRYRYPSAAVSKSHTYPRMQSCHELEVYADDRITCASITATAIFDMSRAFDADGTPRGTPLPCTEVDSSSVATGTAAKVQDCATGLNVHDWLAKGAPSIEGIEWVGSVPHMGFNTAQDIANTPYDATEDIVAAHESEFTQSRRYVITSDERGGGVVPPESACGPGSNQLEMTNGGLHFFPTGSFTTSPPTTAEESWRLWARQPGGEKAVWRATPRAPRPQASTCTAHVFQQIPGQNRIFMGYYSQGTQVVDFIENADGTITFREAGWFIPENANTWTSAIFKMERNADGSWTYWGAASDGILPGTGRSAIDVYKVTLPAPPLPRDAEAGALGGGDPPGPGRPSEGTPPSDTPPSDRPPADRPPAGSGSSSSDEAASRGGVAGASTSGRCDDGGALDRASVVLRGRALGLRHRGAEGPVRVDVFRERGKGHRRVADLGQRPARSSWRPARLADGTYTVRFRTTTTGGDLDVRRVAVTVRRGRFTGVRPAFERVAPCGFVRELRIDRPIVGRRAKLRVRYLLNEAARVSLEVRRRGRVVARVPARRLGAGKAGRVALRLPRSVGAGALTVVLRAERQGAVATVTATARRL